MREASDITGYHAHVYFQTSERETAVALREGLAERFKVDLGRVFDEPMGPHPRAMFQVAFANEEFARIVPWLMLNRSTLSVLVHPNTGDAVGDHTRFPLWLGESLPIDVEFLRLHAK